MTKAELKKEYKKYAKQNKTKGYTFGVIAAIVVLIGAVQKNIFFFNILMIIRTLNAIFNISIIFRYL